MFRLVFLGFSLLLPAIGYSQLRLSRLELQPRETFKVNGTDIAVIDTLILRDSSSLWLNAEKRINYLHVKHMVTTAGSRIVGHGENGADGKNGKKGGSFDGPCRDGLPGRAGTGGTHGADGTTLMMYLNNWVILGRTTIDLSGGNGGDGGHGGEGGGGSPGTRVCKGGSGGVGGDGATGGNGGSAGSLTLQCKNCGDLRSALGEKFIVRVYAGSAGLGGEPGPGGPAGLSATGEDAMEGKPGARGKRGADGVPGKPGAVNLDMLQP
jgi:hypothetical protein